MIAFLRSFGICLVAFLDDVLIIADSPELTEVVIARLHDKEKEFNLEANPDYPDYPVSRFHCKLDKDAPTILRRKTTKLKSSVLSLLENVPKAGEIFFSFFVQGQAALPAFHMAPQGYSERVDSGIFSMGDKVDYKKLSIKRRDQGSTLGLSRSCTTKWQGDYSSKSGFTNFLRCFRDEMGKSSGRNQHRRSLE